MSFFALSCHFVLRVKIFGFRSAAPCILFFTQDRARIKTDPITLKKAMSIKLIAIDMDGTLLLPDHTISPAVKQAIASARERGVNVVLTTGRPYAGVERYLKELDMNQPHDYCITYNGALVQKASDGSTVAQTALSYDDYRYLEQLSREVGSHFHALDRNTLYTANRDISRYTVHESFVATIPLVFCEAEKMDPDTTFLKVMMIDEPEILDKAIARIPAEVREKYTVLKSAPYFLEILDKRVTKGTGVKALADSLNIKPEEVMTIGDQENDIAMLEYAGVGVAMGNAIDSVKKVADYVTKTNLEDGVAYAIKKFVLR
jgi:Cof subfamily protein (haloacid dehalogenase superfamily)